MRVQRFPVLLAQLGQNIFEIQLDFVADFVARDNVVLLLHVAFGFVFRKLAVDYFGQVHRRVFVVEEVEPIRTLLCLRLNIEGVSRIDFGFVAEDVFHRLDIVARKSAFRSTFYDKIAHRPRLIVVVQGVVDFIPCGADSRNEADGNQDDKKEG